MHPPVYISRCATMEQRVKVEASLNALNLPHLVHVSTDPLPQFVRGRMEQFAPRPLVYVETAGDWLKHGLFDELDCDFGHGNGFLYFANNRNARLLVDAWEAQGVDSQAAIASAEEVDGLKVEEL